MQSYHLSSIILRAATRRQCSRTLSSVRVRTLATATTTTSATSSSSPSPPLPTSSSSSPPPPPPSSPLPLSSNSPTPERSETSLPSDPTLHRIVDDISTLTLLQASDLVTLLKSRLNIQEIALPAAGAAAPAGAAAGGAGVDDAAAGEDAAAAAKPKEKTIFNVRLESFDAGSKPKVIKEVKAMVPNLTLIEAKKFVESVPKVLKEGIPKEDAEKIKKAFEAHGAIVVLE